MVTAGWLEHLSTDCGESSVVPNNRDGAEFDEDFTEADWLETALLGHCDWSSPLPTVAVTPMPIAGNTSGAGTPRVVACEVDLRGLGIGGKAGAGARFRFGGAVRARADADEGG